MASVCASGGWTPVISVSLQRGAQLVPAADGGGKEELWEWAPEKQWKGTVLQAMRLSPFARSFLHTFILWKAHLSGLSCSSSGVLFAGEAPQHHPGVSELQRAEPAAAAFSPAAADHADWEHRSHLWTGGKSEPATDSGELETVKNPLKHEANRTVYFTSVQYITKEYFWVIQQESIVCEALLTRLVTTADFVAETNW